MRRAVLMMVLAAGCAQEESARPNVNFGVIIDLTGAVAHPQWRDAAELAVAHANEGLALAGDDRGIRFGVELADSQNLSKTAAKSAAELLGRKNKALVVDTSEDAFAILRTVYDADAGNDLAAPVICIAWAAFSPFPLSRDRSGATIWRSAVGL